MFPRFAIPSILGTLLLSSVAQADLTCAQPIFDAGSLRGGPALKRTFLLRNVGGETIEIHDLKAGCGCLQPRIDRRTLPPGTQATLQVEVSTVTQPEGPNQWRVTVKHSHGELPLEVRARLTRDVSIQPAALVATASQPTNYVFTLTERRENPLSVHAVVSSCPHLDADVSEPRKTIDGWMRTITLRLPATCPPGRHEGVICTHVEDSSCPELKVPFTIHHQPRGRVQATPATVHLFGDKVLPARIVLLGGEGTVLVDRVQADHDAVRCTFAAGPGDRSTLRVVVDGAKLPPGPFTGKVRVELKQPAGEVIEIPVHVTR